MVSDALITHRDGIVGAWQHGLALPELARESTNNLERWEPWVRAEIFDYALHSRLHFSRQANWFTISHLRVNSTGTSAVVRRIMRMRRPSMATFIQQLELVHGYADLREDRVAEITAQMSSPIAFWTSVANLHPDRTRWTLELLGAALRLAGFVEHRFKHAQACRRPVELSPQIQPIILTPGHGAFPSGHATEAHMVAYVLWRLIRGLVDVRWREQLMRQAARVAINRTVAGVHFPIDSAVGQTLGLTLGDYFLHRCGIGGNYDAWTFDGQAYPANLDFDWHLQYTAGGNRPDTAYAWQTASYNVGAVPVLAWLWQRAVAEWT